ncbi:transposable element Tcb1 transposase [Trichonephila clavipes]|nr:transposable element Tcb1 transposase [Trichonephila clavipes]
MPFATEWNVRKGPIASFTLDCKPHAFAPPNGTMNGGNGQWKGMTLCLLTNPACACNITMVGFEFGDTMVRGCQTVALCTGSGPAPDILVKGDIGLHCPCHLVRIADTLNSQCYISEVLEPVVLPYIQRLPSAIFQQDNA